MGILDELIILDETLLNELNVVADRTIEEKNKFNIDYNLLENVLGAFIQNQRHRKTGSVSKVVPIKKEEMLAVALDFFQSVDNEFYEKARDVILGQLKRIKMNMYSIHDVKSFEIKDEHGLRERTPDGSVQTDKGYSVVNIPLQERLSPKEAKVVLNPGEGTLDDLYTIVHEISHLFDLNQANTLPTTEDIVQGRKPNCNQNFGTRELLGETTAIAFEGLLTNYLLEKGKYPKLAVIDCANKRTNSSLSDARITYAKLLLAKEKVKTGRITNEYIEDMMQTTHMSVLGIRDLAKNVARDNRPMLYRNRYAVAGIVAPTIVKVCEDNKTDGVQSLKQYLKAVYDDNFEGAINALGIELAPQGIVTLVKNMKTRDAKINSDKER